MFDLLFNYIKILAVQIRKRVFREDLHYYYFFNTSHFEPFDDGFTQLSQIIIKPQKPFSMNKFDYEKFQGHFHHKHLFHLQVDEKFVRRTSI